MNKQQQAFDEMKQAYLEVMIPNALDDAIKRGALEGKNRINGQKLIHEKNHKYNGPKTLVAAAAVLIVLVASLNLSPAFAEQLSGIPFIGQFVKVLIFTDGKASGGIVTDGLDVSAVSSEKSGNTETFSIHFEQGDQPQDLSGAYTVKYAQNPDTLFFQISGVRMFSAVEDFDAMKNSALVEDVYPLITLDDSMIRFMIVFKEPVVYEVLEMKNPASLVLHVSPGIKTAEDLSKFRIRTIEMPRGEFLGMIEEFLVSTYPHMRIFHVSKESENYFIELEQLDSQEAAEEALEKAKGICPDVEMLIEAVPDN